jgi:DNA polymerase III subunit delta'
MVELTGDRGVIGHQRVLDLLDREATGPANAYLFVGATGIGKATVARRFAAALLCPEGGGHGADCRSCRRALAGVHPDLTLVEPEGSRSLGVDQARTAIGMAALAPVESARKVFLFDDAGSMTDQAANALLKTLEEPSATTVFLLVAESEDDLPPTVGSRCRTIHFGRVDEVELAAALADSGVEPERALTVARVAGGRPGMALMLAHRPEVAGFRSMWLNVPLRVSARPGDAFRLGAEVLEALEPMLEARAGSEGATKAEKERAERERRRIRQTLLTAGLEILASWYADSAALQLGGPVRNRDLPLSVFTTITPAQAVQRAERVLDAVTDLQANLRPQLVLANLFAALGEEG